MRFCRNIIPVFISILFISSLLYASGDVRLGGGAATGRGTDPVYFDDDSLIHTPVPTPTAIYNVTKYEKQAWDRLSMTKNLIERCETDLTRYEKFMRKEFMSDLNEMMDVASRIHTYAVLHRRDQVEHAWSEKVRNAENTLAICEEYVDEFNEDYREMKRNQKKAIALVKKYKKKRKIQRPAEMEQLYQLNKEQMFYVKKRIDYFTKLYNNYVASFKKMIRDKEQKVAKLLKDHYDLHKP